MNYSIKHKTMTVLLLCIMCMLYFVSRAEADSAYAMLESGGTVNNKMRYLSAGEDRANWGQTGNIIAVRMADSLPGGFVPSAENTVSTIDSENPIYIFFDNTDDQGIMYFYSGKSRIVMNSDSSFLFFNFPSLTDISGVESWDSSQVTSMYSIFAKAKKLTDASALRNWDTSNVTNMQYMFSGASSLIRIDVSKWNTGKVTTMSGMFQVGDNWKGNGQLIEIVGLGNLDVSNVTDMTCMFYGAGKMTQYDISGWNVSKVESMNHMFCDNASLRALDLSKWDVSSLKTIYNMFNDNQALKTIGDVSQWNTSNLIDAGCWLNYCTTFVGDNSGTLDLSGWDTSNLKSASEMFIGTKIRTIDLTGWTFDSITNDPWEGAGKGIYYTYGNETEQSCGLEQMFSTMWKLGKVYLSQTGLDSYNRAAEEGVNIQNMWLDSKIAGFTVK